MNAAASAFDHGYTLTLAITTLALAAGSAFTYRLPHPAAHYPRRTGPAPRTGPARRVAAKGPALAETRFACPRLTASRLMARISRLNRQRRPKGRRLSMSSSAS